MFNSLNNFCELIIDCEHKTAPVTENGYPSIRTPNIGRGRLILDNVNRVSEATYAAWTKRAVPRADDLILAREAPAGNVAIVPRNLKLCLGQRTVLIRPDKKRIDPKYLLYLLLESKTQAKLLSYSAGCTVSHVNMSDIRGLELPDLPPLNIQSKIASILSAYDDLIENNLRRIKILEEMAKTIYDEWFVKFRFPGHEKVKMVESELGLIPEGWRFSTIGEACLSLVDGDWIETKDQGGKDFRLLQVSNMGVGEFIETGNYRYITQDTFKKLNCTEVLPGQILISRMPKPTGRAWLVTEMPWRMITAVDVAILSPNNDVLSELLFLNILNSPRQLELVARHSTGTTRERISRSAFSKLPILLPPVPLQTDFSAITEPCYNQITCLRRKNDILRQTRDLLLPKLISGEIDVENLDIRIGDSDEPDI